MTDPTPGGRSFKHAGGVGPGRYARLFDVVVQHEHYNKRDDLACPDITAYPSARTRDMMHSLGLLFRTQPGGFSVLYSEDRTVGLERYLRTNTLSLPGRELERWTYLSIFLAATSARIAAVTGVPEAYHPVKTCFYFSNRWQSSGDGPTLLSKRPTAGDAELYLTRPARFSIAIPRGGKALLTNVAGATDVTIDRAAYKATAKGTPGAADGPMGQGRTFVPGFFELDAAGDFYGAHVDLSQLYEGFYRLQVIDRDGRPVRGSDEEFIYTTVQPIPIGYMHIHLNEISHGKGGVYPIEIPESEGLRFTFQRYLVRFKALAARWAYHVVPRPGMSLSDLKIEAASGDPPAFDGPVYPVRLPTGADAYQFVSREPLSLKQRPEINLRLVGRRSDIPGEAGVLLPRLPVPSVEHAPSRHGKDIVSDVYVYV